MSENDYLSLNLIKHLISIKITLCSFYSFFIFISENSLSFSSVANHEYIFNIVKCRSVNIINVNNSLLTLTFTASLRS